MFMQFSKTYHRTQQAFALLIALVLPGLNALCSDAGSTNGNAPSWEQLTASAVRALKAGLPADAERLCSQAMNLVSEAGAGDTRPSKTHTLMGEIQRWQKKLDLAEQSFKSAAAACEKAVGPNHAEMVYPLEGLANFYYYTKVQYDEVASLYQRILNIVENAPTPNPVELATRARNLADVHQLRRDYAAAEPLYRRALALAEQDGRDVMQYLLAQAGLYRAWGKSDQAEPPAKRALALAEKGVGTDAQLDVAVCLDSLGAIYLASGKHDLAEASYRRALAITEKIAGAESSDLAPRLIGLGASLRAKGRFDDAEAQYKRALTVTEKGLGPDFVEVAEVLENYSVLLAEMKRSDEAKAQLARADSIRKRAAE
jgi:tetratricopeptide (TPR) repeat protein